MTNAREWLEEILDDFRDDGVSERELALLQRLVHYLCDENSFPMPTISCSNSDDAFSSPTLRWRDENIVIYFLPRTFLIGVGCNLAVDVPHDDFTQVLTVLRRQYSVR